MEKHRQRHVLNNLDEDVVQMKQFGRKNLLHLNVRLIINITYKSISHKRNLHLLTDTQ